MNDEYVDEYGYTWHRAPRQGQIAAVQPAVQPAQDQAARPPPGLEGGTRVARVTTTSKGITKDDPESNTFFFGVTEVKKKDEVEDGAKNSFADEKNANEVIENDDENEKSMRSATRRISSMTCSA